MHVNQVTPKFNFTSLPNPAPQNNVQKPRGEMSKGEKISLGMISGGSLLVIAYFLLGGKGKTKVDSKTQIYSDAFNKPKFAYLSDKIKKKLKGFVPRYEEALPDSYRKLNNGKTIVQYKTVNSYGDILTDNIVFDKDDKIIRRFFIHKNPYKGEHKGKLVVQSYKGGDILLHNPKHFPQGECDPNYFVKHYLKDSKRQIGDNRYLQNVFTFDKDGNFRSNQITTNTSGTSLSMLTSGGKAPTFINNEKSQDFKWGYKIREYAKNYLFCLNEKNKITGFAQQTVMENAKPIKTKVFAKIFGEEIKEYSTYDELISQNKNFKSYA